VVFRACGVWAGAWRLAATDPELWRMVQPQVADRRFWRVVDLAAAALAQVVAGLHEAAVAAVLVVVPVGVARCLVGVVARLRAGRVQGALCTTSSDRNGADGVMTRRYTVRARAA